MPPFIKDELKKKDEQILSDMQKEIDRHSESSDTFEDREPHEDREKPEGDTQLPPWDPSTLAEEPEETVALKEEIEKLTVALKESDSSLKRLRADFENFRRRTAKEKEELSAVVLQELLKDMLPLLDNFERALAAESAEGESFRQGVEMIYSQFAETLKKEGLELIEAEGKTFDPNFHQAVMRVENPDLAEGAIAGVLQKGYMAKGRVLRPSMVQVVVSQAPGA